MDIWTEEFAAIPDDISVWNQNVIPWMKERGKDYQKVAMLEAVRRGYQFDYAQMEFRKPWKMFACKGRNLLAVGYQNGVLRCAFHSKTGARFYRYTGPSEEDFEKIKSNPFPDRLFTLLVKNKSYPCISEEAEKMLRK